MMDVSLCVNCEHSATLNVWGKVYFNVLVNILTGLDVDVSQSETSILHNLSVQLCFVDTFIFAPYILL